MIRPIVIGSGIGGLTAAAHLGRRGHPPLVLEAADKPGGYLNPFRRKKYVFDVGLHYVGDLDRGESLYRILAPIGVTGHVEFRELDPQAIDLYCFPGYEAALPKGADRFRDRLAADFPSHRRDLDRFFDLLRRVRRGMAGLADLRSASNVIALARTLPGLAGLCRMTYSQLLDRYFVDRLLKAVLSGPCGDAGLPPGRMAAIAGVALLNHFLGGAWYPVGGSGALRDALVRAVEHHGGEIRTGARVRSIEVNGRWVSAVVLESGERIPSRCVVSNADAKVTYGELIDAAHLSRRLIRKVDRLRPSIGAFYLFLGTSLDLAAMGFGEANVWVYPTTDIDSIYAPALAGELGPMDSYFLTIPTLKDPDSGKAPAGHHTLEIITLAPYEPFERWADKPPMKRGREYSKLKKQLAERLLANVEATVPGLGGSIEFLEAATPLTNLSYVNAPRGSVYGPEHTPDQIAWNRFAPIGAIKGLFVCGSSVMGGGIEPCATSGYIAAQLATDLALKG